MNKEIYELTIRTQFEQINELCEQIDKLQEENKRLKEHKMPLTNDVLLKFNEDFKSKLLDILRNEGEIKYLGYSDKECINCGRERVERYSDGTEICEKCNFDQNKKEYVMR